VSRATAFWRRSLPPLDRGSDRGGTEPRRERPRIRRATSPQRRRKGRSRLGSSCRCHPCCGACTSQCGQPSRGVSAGLADMRIVNAQPAHVATTDDERCVPAGHPPGQRASRVPALVSGDARHRVRARCAAPSCAWYSTGCFPHGFAGPDVVAEIAADGRNNHACWRAFIRLFNLCSIRERHQMLEIAYYIMRDGARYQELGADYLDRRHSDRAARRHVRQLEALGFQVTITKAA